MRNITTSRRTTRLAKNGSDVIGNVVLRPRRMAKLVLGMYEKTMPLPKFRLQYSPMATDTIDASLFKFDGDDHYTLVYHFQNYSDTTYHITVVSE